MHKRGRRCAGTRLGALLLAVGVVAVTVAAAEPGCVVVTKEGSGTGVVVSDAAPKIDCGYRCGGNYAADTPVTLTATAASGSAFMGWSGACTGAGPSCTVTALSGQQQRVTALFARLCHGDGECDMAKEYCVPLLAPGEGYCMPWRQVGDRCGDKYGYHRCSPQLTCVVPYPMRPYEGVCLQPCVDDASCANGQYCGPGSVCLDPCSADTDCFWMQTCDLASRRCN